MSGFVYGLTLRPAGPGAVPEGYTKYDEFGSYDDSGERDRATRHGTVTYPNELSDEQIQKFELVPIHNEAYLQRWIEKAWAKLGKYAHKYLEMGGEDALSKQMRSLADRFGPIHSKEYEKAEQEIIKRANSKQDSETIEEKIQLKTTKVFRRNTDKDMGGDLCQSSQLMKFLESKQEEKSKKAFLNKCSTSLKDGLVNLGKKNITESLQSSAKNLVWNNQNWLRHVRNYFSNYKEDSDTRDLFEKFGNSNDLSKIEPLNGSNEEATLFRVRLDDSIHRIILRGIIKYEILFVDDISFFNYKEHKKYRNFLELVDNNIIHFHESVQSDREIRWLSDLIMNSLTKQIRKRLAFNGAATVTSQFENSRDWNEIQSFLKEWDVTVVFADSSSKTLGSWYSETKTIYLSEPKKDDGLSISLGKFIRGEMGEDTFKRQIKTSYGDILVHELTHAFDDYRSKGKFKNKDYKNPDQGGDKEYWLSQIEINARFAHTSHNLIRTKLSLDSGSGNGFEQYLKSFKDSIGKWEDMPEWVQKRLKGRIYKEYSELQPYEKDAILVNGSWGVLHSALKSLVKDSSYELPEELIWTDADYRLKDDKAYNENQRDTLNKLIKKTIKDEEWFNQLGDVSSLLNKLVYIIDDIQDVLFNNKEAEQIVAKYFDLSDEEIKMIKEKTWYESNDARKYFFKTVNLCRNLIERTMYHGTNKVFKEFSKSAETRNAKNYGVGHYFTSSPENASDYAGDGEASNVHIVDVEDKNLWDVSDYSGYEKISKHLGLDMKDKSEDVNWFEILVQEITNKKPIKEVIKYGSSSGFLSKAITDVGYDGVIVPSEYTGSRKGDWYVVYNENIIKHKYSENDEYKGEHDAPGPWEGYAPMWDLRAVYPEDVYESGAERLYSSGSDFDNEAFSIIRSAKGRRDKQVVIYRAVPKDISNINIGDWVTITRGYAKEHGESNLNNDYKIIKKTVNARDLFTDGNSIQEWGYQPQPFIPKKDRDPKWEKWPGKMTESGIISEQPNVPQANPVTPPGPTNQSTPPDPKKAEQKKKQMGKRANDWLKQLTRLTPTTSRELQMGQVGQNSSAFFSMLSQIPKQDWYKYFFKV